MAAATSLVRAALRRSPDQLRYIQPVSSASATGLVGQLYEQIEREFGMLAPPLTLHSAEPELLAASWILLRENLIVDGALPRATKEAIAAAVSVSNACPYCIEVHSTAVHSMADGASARSLREDRFDAIPDRGIREAAIWAQRSGQPRPAPFDDSELVEAVGVATTFQYINRMVSIFLPESPLPAQLPAGARTVAGRLLGWHVRSVAAAGERPAGQSLQLLPAAEATPAWARPNPRLADAFARAGAAFDRAAQRYVAEPVRALVPAVLAGWDGAPPQLDHRWLDAPVGELPEPLRPAGVLAVTTALAADRVTPTMIADYQRTEPAEAALLALTGWVSLQTASWTARRDALRNPAF